MRDWRRHLYYRTECVKTTWKLRVGVLAVIIAAGALSHRLSEDHIARSLICDGDLAPSDIILVENFDPNYVLFERAAALQKAGIAPRIVVPVQGSHEVGVANP